MNKLNTIENSQKIVLFLLFYTNLSTSYGIGLMFNSLKLFWIDHCQILNEGINKGLLKKSNKHGYFVTQKGKEIISNTSFTTITDELNVAFHSFIISLKSKIEKMEV